VLSRQRPSTKATQHAAHNRKASFRSESVIQRPGRIHGTAEKRKEAGGLTGASGCTHDRAKKLRQVASLGSERHQSLRCPGLTSF